MSVRKLLALLLCSSAAAAAADGALHFKVLRVSELASRMKADAEPPVIFDVNVESTRSHIGIIPGSRLLSSSSSFDAAKELPQDKGAQLVFYCANQQCTASHTAAERAIAQGYKDVSVMIDGIYGWKKAGEPLEPVGGKAPAPVAPQLAAALTGLHAALIVDVREDEERHEVIGNARSMPMSRISDAKAWSEFEAKLPKGKTIVFHCAAGARAKRAAEKLAADGFKTAYFQGPDQWKSAGLPLEKGPAE